MAAPTIELISVEDLQPETLREIAAMKTAFWHEVLPADPAVSAETVSADLRAHRPGTDVQHLLARCEGGVAGIASVMFATRGPNTDTASCTLEVAPRHRRRRVGTALLTAIVDRATDRGCRSIVPWGLRTEVSSRFWDRFDLAEVQHSRRSRVPIADIDPELMLRWRTSSKAKARGYELKRFVGSCPDDLLEQYVQALSGLHDAPIDDLDFEPPTVDSRDVREFEEDAAQLGLMMHVIVALGPRGEAAGVTEIAVSAHTPHLVAQQVTTTLADHRRQGIGRWLKAEMYFHIIERLPAAQIIETGNAASNAAMVAVNDEMGFVPVLAFTTRQADIAAVATALADQSRSEG